MNDLLNISTAKLQRIIAVKKQIERLQAQLAKLAGAASSAAAAAAPRKKRRKMSAAGRKAISDAAKARWAKIKAAKRK
jgi:hypothetical protein